MEKRRERDREKKRRTEVRETARPTPGKPNQVMQRNRTHDQLTERSNHFLHETFSFVGFGVTNGSQRPRTFFLSPWITGLRANSESPGERRGERTLT